MNFYTIARGAVKALSYVFFPVKVHGDMSNIPEDSGVVFCANHISYLDVIFVGISIKRQLFFVAKKKYADKPVLKQLFKALGAFGIDTEKPDLTAIKNCFRIIKENKILGIFPEGTRILKGKKSNPMPGAMMIAHKTHAPIFYVRIKPRKKFFRLFVTTDVYVGGLITAEELGVTDGKGEQYKTASINLMKKIYSLGETCR